MKKTVRVHLNNFIVLLISSLFISFILSFIFYSGFKIMQNLEKNVYADSINLKIDEVQIVEEYTIPIYEEKEIDVIRKPVSMKKIGDFYLTAYCPCDICCEQWGGSPIGKTTSIGVGAYEGVTFAVDPSKIPYGSKLYIEGVGVGIATDCGGAIKGNRIDVYFSDHQAALEFGRAGGVAHSVYVLN